MHLEVLTKEQKELYPLIKQFIKEYYLVGGTAMALHLGHRLSVDYDLFTDKNPKRQRIKKLIKESGFNYDFESYEDYEQLHCKVNSVKMTFFKHYNVIPAENYYKDIFRIPDLLDLAVMKADALGTRGKWKDYVDLYFIIKDHFSIKQIVERANELLGNEFNAKLFLSQLSYFDDLKYFRQEKVDYLRGFEVNDTIIQKFLTERSVNALNEL